MYGVAFDLLAPKDRVEKCLVVRVQSTDFVRNVTAMNQSGQVYDGDLHQLFATLNWKGAGVTLEHLDHAACVGDRPQGRKEDGPRHQNAHLPALHVKTISERTKDTMENLLTARAIEGDGSFDWQRRHDSSS